MGSSACYDDKAGLRKGPWTAEEDKKLLDYIKQHGRGSWPSLPAKAGLQRCGKSCRLRWINYLSPHIKRGKFSLWEEQTIIQLHALLGNKWSAIASHLPKRTDNEIKNHWNTHLKKRLTKMGIDPVTHKPKTDALGSVIVQSKDATNLGHMAQWESARLEAEARFVKETKPVSKPPLDSSSTERPNKGRVGQARQEYCSDVFKAWQGVASGMFGITKDSLESPASTFNIQENTLINPTFGLIGDNVVLNSTSCFEEPNHMEGWKENMNKSMALHEMMYSTDQASMAENFIFGGLSDIIDCDSGAQNSSVDGEYCNAAYNGSFEDDKNYWNNFINLVNASATWSPVF